MTLQACSCAPTRDHKFSFPCSCGVTLPKKILWLLLLALALGACVRQGLPKEACTRPDLAGCDIDDVDILENDTISDGDIEDNIATAETSRVLAGAVEHVPVLSVWDKLTVEYELFDRFVLERDLARIERYYRARGFYEAHARAARVVPLGEKKVRVEIVVDEGLPIDKIAVEPKWLETDDQLRLGSYAHAEDLTDARIAVENEINLLREKNRFEEADYDAMKKAVVRALTDRGFAYAKIESHAYVDLPSRSARVTLEVEPGPFCTFGDVHLVGLGEVPERPIRTAIAIRKGRRYSTNELESAEYALAEFGVFGSVEIKPELSPEGQPKKTEVPITFTLQPTTLRAVKAGLGGEIGDRFEVHAIGGWESRNFLGGLRRFNIEARPGLVFHPATVSSPLSVNEILPEMKLNFELRQPGLIEARTNGIARGRFSLFHYRTNGTDECNVNVDDENIIGYREYAGTLGVERTFWKSRHSIGLFTNLQVSQPFSYNLDAPPEGFRDVIIPYLEALTWLDLRKNADDKPDKITPTKGIYLAADVQAAFDLFKQGGDDVRFQPEFRAYIPISKKVTLAYHLSTGFLFPRSYGEDLRHRDDPFPAGASEEELAGLRAERQTRVARDLQLLSFRGFFSGGVNSNRGYGYRGVGPHAQINSLFQSTEVVDCRIPTGGDRLWETSLELRLPISGNLRSALFLDASDVTLGTMRLTRPHMSAGLGLRYDTPVGPLRGDVGYRIPCLQAFDVPCDEAPADEGRPGDILGLPIAVSVAIGEAF